MKGDFFYPRETGNYYVISRQSKIDLSENCKFLQMTTSTAKCDFVSTQYQWPQQARWRDLVQVVTRKNERKKMSFLYVSVSRRIFGLRLYNLIDVQPRLCNLLVVWSRMCNLIVVWPVQLLDVRSRLCNSIVVWPQFVQFNCCVTSFVQFNCCVNWTRLFNFVARLTMTEAVS